MVIVRRSQELQRKAPKKVDSGSTGHYVEAGITDLIRYHYTKGKHPHTHLGSRPPHDFLYFYSVFRPIGNVPSTVSVFAFVLVVGSLFSFWHPSVRSPRPGTCALLQPYTSFP